MMEKLVCLQERRKKVEQAVYSLQKGSNGIKEIDVFLSGRIWSKTNQNKIAIQVLPFC